MPALLRSAAAVVVVVVLVALAAVAVSNPPFAESPRASWWWCTCSRHACSSTAGRFGAACEWHDALVGLTGLP